MENIGFRELYKKINSPKNIVNGEKVVICNGILSRKSDIVKHFLFFKLLSKIDNEKIIYATYFRRIENKGINPLIKYFVLSKLGEKTKGKSFSPPFQNEKIEEFLRNEMKKIDISDLKKKLVNVNKLFLSKIYKLSVVGFLTSLTFYQSRPLFYVSTIGFLSSLIGGALTAKVIDYIENIKRKNLKVE